MADDQPQRWDRLLDQLAELEDVVETPAAGEQVREVMRAAVRVSRPAGPFGTVIEGFVPMSIARPSATFSRGP